MRDLVETTTRLLTRRLSRRGFLVRAALAGSALATNPFGYVLRPGTAYARICGCNGARCACGSLCCDGYTDFCCALTEINACPSGTVSAGWWKADGSGLCSLSDVGQPRYYVDCNAVCGDCGCNGSGICDCVNCGCECAGGDCGRRGTCCVRFRYGQCHQELACVGPIVCRVVTCTPPWVWDTSCTTTVATDNFTRTHDAPCLHGFPASGQVVVGDWDGDGIATPGLVVDGTWYLRNSITPGPPEIVFSFGVPGDVAVVGDWNGDGIDSPGVFRNGTWFLRQTPSTGPADIMFSFGNPGDRPVVGDWNGDGIDSPGVFRNGNWLLRNPHSSGHAEKGFSYGDPDDLPVAGDWDGDGVDSPGVFRRGRWFLRNPQSSGPADLTFEYGDDGDVPVVGRWQQQAEGLGVVRASVWYLRDQANTGPADHSFYFLDR